MLDIKFIRDHVDAVKDNMRKKFQDHKIFLVDEVVSLYDKSREIKLKGDSLRADRNRLSSEIGVFMREGKKSDAEDMKLQVARY